MVVFTSISIAKAGSSSQSPIFTPFNSTGGGCGTQANTYSDRTRSQGASSDPGEGSQERRLNGRQLYVWRAVDSEGKVLDILVQPWRDRKAALNLMRKLLKKQGVTPVTIVTD